MSGWIGVDLDGTLAYYDGWKGTRHIGEPILPMVNRVKEWLKEGKKVKILTARAYNATVTDVKTIEAWCIEHIGQKLDITCIKDYTMMELWDDRAVSVVTNKGIGINANEK